MGALHAGHVSLIQAAANDHSVVVVSIFVNPLQFGPSEDFDRYPRTFDADLAECEAAGATDVFAPSVEEMYPGGKPATSVSVSGITEVLDGLSRPGHFDGVATVVAKLFSIVGECSAYFGEKDWQQLAVVRRMAADLSMPVEVIGCPIVREVDGLAMSSRNRYLTSEERISALALSAALRASAQEYAKGARNPVRLEQVANEVLSSVPGIDVEYVSLRDRQLREPKEADDDCRLLVAAKVGRTRLIDNMGMQ